MYETYSVIIATGASVKWLGLDNEKDYLEKAFPDVLYVMELSSSKRM